MNINLLNKEVQYYINANLNSDLHSLLLKKSPFSKVTIQEIAEQIKGKLVADKKFPFLLKNKILFPKNLSLEQSSSVETALYKKILVEGNSMIDLTSGFGIDAFFISQNFQEITLVESQKELLEIVEHNWEVLGRKAQFINQDLYEFLNTNKQSFDLIYLDPARRDGNKKKVFLLQDLSPNILEIQSQLLEMSGKVMIKLSPLIDISYLVSEIKNLKEIHIVAVKNDVKELLILIEKNYTDDVMVKAVNLLTEEPEFSFNYNTQDNKIEYSDVLRFLYIPNNAILKSGNFNGVATFFHLKKLDVNTHFYTSNEWVANFPGRVLEVEKINSKQIKKGEYYNIISKNHPMKPAEIKKKYGLKDGGNQYLIFTQSKNKKIILKSYDKY